MVGEILQSMINLPPIQISPGSDLQSDPRLGITLLAVVPGIFFKASGS
jgi:hypothetical protein